MTALDTGAPPSGGTPRAEPFDAAQVDAFVHRLRGGYAQVHPEHWQIDWRSIPSPFRWYADLPRIDLPPLSRAAAAGGTAAARAVAAASPAARLGALLQAAYGVTGVRWYPEGIAKSSPEEPTPVHRNPHYQLRRAVPSGGVTYPAECYLATEGIEGIEGTDGVDAGLYHYDAVRHALAVLSAGSPPAGLAPPRGAVRVVLTQPLWKNYFKYGDFSYRLGAMDTGAVVGQFALCARSMGLACRVTFSTDERLLLGLLGLDSEQEAAPAVLDVTVGGTGRGPRRASADAAGALAAGRPRWLGASTAPGPDTGTRRMHAACLAAGRPGRPIDLPPVALETSEGDSEVELPAVPAQPLSAAESWTRSALGEQFRGTPIALGVLSGWLTETLAPMDCDVPGNENRLSHPRCVLLVRSVPGVPAGAYLPDRDGRRLSRLAEGDFGPLVQRSMFANYMNVGQAPLVAVMVGAAEPHRGAGGPVAYRVQHLLAGVLAQRLSVCAARDGMSAHPVLGFVSGLLDDAIGLTPRRLTSLLLVAVGGYRRGLYLENSLNPSARAARTGGGR
ncbi:NADH oxidase [Planomonospora sphaerica]|uniref:NADH oxidase n=1 Tax=Planomonospora sphaerica TaxID=161355 RepID=A0A161LNI8_9ACTN|nr:SagB family peptide dehydrogenase [Planomonospora sphaerica]GAT69285.1 NADH oxidase [Planomonospora sphaerica]